METNSNLSLDFTFDESDWEYEVPSYPYGVVPLIVLFMAFLPISTAL